MSNTYENYGSRCKTCLQIQTEPKSKSAWKFWRPWQTVPLHSIDMLYIHHVVFTAGRSSGHKTWKWTSSAKSAKFREPSQSTSKRQKILWNCIAQSIPVEVRSLVEKGCDISKFIFVLWQTGNRLFWSTVLRRLPATTSLKHQDCCWVNNISKPRHIYWMHSLKLAQTSKFSHQFFSHLQIIMFNRSIRWHEQ